MQFDDDGSNAKKIGLNIDTLRKTRIFLTYCECRAVYAGDC